MGGGGFSMEPDNPRLDLYVLRQTGKPSPRVLFQGTAGGDRESYLVRFYTAFSGWDCRPSHLSLFEPPRPDLRAFVLSQDLIYVGGGSTRSMLAVWREWGLGSLLRDAYDGGVVLAGVSAGAICWFAQGLTDSLLPGGNAPLPCLGFLPGSFCPHYDGEARRRPDLFRLMHTGEICGGLAADDGAAAHFVDGRFHLAVSSRPAARVYRVERDLGGLPKEEIIRTDYLDGNA